MMVSSDLIIFYIHCILLYFINKAGFDVIINFIYCHYDTSTYQKTRSYA